MGDVVDLSDSRLAVLRASEARVETAKAALATVEAADGETAERLLWALRVALELQADGHAKGLTADPDLEAAGAAALDRLDAARKELGRARGDLGRTIATLVSTGRFAVGDVLVRDGRELICESIFSPLHDPTLAEATFTADGGPIEKSWHSWQLDGETGRPVVADIDPVRFERWWGGGLRGGGWVHPTSRKIVRTD